MPAFLFLFPRSDTRQRQPYIYFACQNVPSAYSMRVRRACCSCPLGVTSFVSSACSPGEIVFLLRTRYRLIGSVASFSKSRYSQSTAVTAFAPMFLTRIEAMKTTEVPGGRFAAGSLREVLGLP